MSRDEKLETAVDLISIIQEAIPAIPVADLFKHKRRKKVLKSWHTIMFDQKFNKQKQEENIREFLWAFLNGMLEQLKDGKSIPPEYHDKPYCDCDFSWWRNQFIVSSSDGEYHFLVTVEIGAYSLQITFEMEVE